MLLVGGDLETIRCFQAVSIVNICYDIMTRLTLNSTLKFLGHIVLKTAPKRTKIVIFQNWLKTHPEVVNAQNKHVIAHFKEILELKSGLCHPKYHFLALENIRQNHPTSVRLDHGPGKPRPGPGPKP